MKRYPCPLLCLLLLLPAHAQDAPPKLPAEDKPPVIRAAPTAPAYQHQPRHRAPSPPGGQGYFQRPARWEYCIFEIRVRESEIGGGLFQLHMPGRSSGRNKDLGKVFREVHMQIQKTSRIDEVNALNTLGALGWELTSTQKKDGRAGISVFYYFKRRI